MSIGAAEAESARADEDLAIWERCLLGGEAQADLAKVDEVVWARRLGLVVGHMHRPRHEPLGGDERGLDDRRHARRALEVANASLGAAHEHRRLHGGSSSISSSCRGGASSASEHPAEGLELNGVAQWRARAVRLDVGHLAHVETLVGHAQQPLLRRRVGRRQPIGKAVLVDGRGGHLCVDVAEQRAGHVVEARDEDAADALTAHVAVGVVGAEAAALRVAEHARALEGIGPDPAELHVDAGDEGGGAMPCPDSGDGLGEGDERRGARRVEGDGGAGQVEQVRDAVGGDRSGPRGAHVWRRVGAPLLDHRLHEACVVDCRDADEDAHRAVGELLDAHTRVDKGLVRRMQQQPLLRVHERRLGRVDAKAQRVKAHESAFAQVARRPAVVRSVSRRRADGVDAAAQVGPEGLGRVCASRQPAAHPGDDEAGGHIRRRGLSRRRLATSLLVVAARRIIDAQLHHMKHGLGQGLQRHALVDERGGELEGGQLSEPADEVDHVHRREAHFAHGQREVDRLILCVRIHHLLEQLTQRVDELGQSLASRDRCQQPAILRPRRRAAARAARSRATGRRCRRRHRHRIADRRRLHQLRGQWLRQPWAAGASVGRPACWHVGIMGQPVGGAGGGRGHQQAERRQPSIERDEVHPLPLPVLFEAGTEAVRHAGTCPRAPAHGERRQALAESRVRQAVLVGVGRRVVRELRVAQQAVDGREEDEVVERHLARRRLRVQVVRAMDLGGALREEVGPAQVDDAAVTREARQVEDPRQRLGGTRGVSGQDVGHLLLGSDVAPAADDLGASGARPLEGGHGLLGRPARAAGQHEARRAAPLARGEQRKPLKAQAAQPTCEQVRRLWAHHLAARRARCRWRRGRHQARHEARAPPPRRLRAPQRRSAIAARLRRHLRDDGGGVPRGVGLAGAEVEHVATDAAAVGALGGDDARKAPARLHGCSIRRRHRRGCAHRRPSRDDPHGRAGGGDCGLACREHASEHLLGGAEGHRPLCRLVSRPQEESVRRGAHRRLEPTRLDGRGLGQAHVSSDAGAGAPQRCRERRGQLRALGRPRPDEQNASVGGEPSAGGADGGQRRASPLDGKQRRRLSRRSDRQGVVGAAGGLARGVALAQLALGHLARARHRQLGER